jgi:hypothetical protein
MEDNFWSQTPTQPYNKLYVHDEHDEKDEKDGDNRLIDGYEMSQNIDTPYSTPVLLGIMREISAPAHAGVSNQYRYFFQDDDCLK